MTRIADWVALRENLKRWGEEWDAGIVEVRLSDGRMMYIDDAVPDTRAECPTQRPCGHVKCRYHLWRIDGDSRAGRPGLASVPRDERGLTLRIVGALGNERAGTTLEARWLETPVPPSCALDESGCVHDNIAVGYRMNRHRTMVARDVRKALIKIKAAGYDLRWLVKE